MNPLWIAALRRQWPLVGAIAVFAVFTIADQVAFRPTARRFDAALKRAAQVGMAIDPDQAAPILSPRLFALLADNAMPAAEAQTQGNSGVLTAQFMSELTELMGHQGIQVIVTEPGPVTQQPLSARLTAHLKLRCRYPQFVATLDELARGTHLIAMDRFQLAPQTGGYVVVEVWMSRYVIKQQKARG